LGGTGFAARYLRRERKKRQNPTRTVHDPERTIAAEKVMLGIDIIGASFWRRTLSCAQRKAPIAQLRASGLRAVRLLSGSMAVVAAVIAISSSSHSQTPADDVAAKVRSQGYRCDQPITATRDVKASRPDSPVWVLTCRHATYRVRLDPDMAARVTTLKTPSH
jgi:hypothetical protein